MHPPRIQTSTCALCRHRRSFFGSLTDFRHSERTYHVTHAAKFHATRAKIKAAPKTQEPLRYRRYELLYWVGNNSCENPIVLIERNDGVLGGKNCGPSVKF